MKTNQEKLINCDFKEYDLVFYETESGCMPVLEFLELQSPKMQAKIHRSFLLLSKSGPYLGEPFSKSLGDGLFELRCQTEGNTTRLLYFFIQGKRIVLTNGYMKKTMKVPIAEIIKAKKYRLDYLNQNKGRNP
jgi:phage-related protein